MVFDHGRLKEWNSWRQKGCLRLPRVADSSWGVEESVKKGEGREIVLRFIKYLGESWRALFTFWKV